MVRGVSEILVRITGDTKGLTTALRTADRSVGGMGGSLLKGAVALGALKLGFDALEETTEQADRLGDATARLEIQLGTLSGPLVASADEFRRIGQSSQDILELEANFADLATTLGITNPQIAGTADEVAATAAAVSLLEDVDAATVIEQIGKAAGGSERAMLALGVSVDEAEVVARALATTGKATAESLTDGELAAARLSLILEQLAPKIAAAATSGSDLEQNQRALDAASEELAAKLGGPLSDALADVLGFINDEIDAIPGAIEGWKMLGAAIEGFGRTALGPLGNVRDVLQGILDLLGQVGDALPGGPGRDLDAFESQVSDAVRRSEERNGLSGHMGR